MRSITVQNEKIAVNVLSISHDAIIATDDSQMIITFNNGAERIFGYPGHEIIGQPLSLLLPPSSVEIYREKVINALVSKGGPNQTDNLYKLIARRKDGTIFPCEVIISTATNKGRKILISILRDITEEKRVKEALFRSEEKLRSYVKNSLDGIFHTDETGHYLEVNSSFCRIAGYSKNEMLHKSFLDLLSEESLTEGVTHLQKLVQNGSATTNLWFKHKDGSDKYLTIAAIKLSEMRFLGFSKDNTRLKLDEEEIKKLNKILHRKVIRSEKRSAELVIANKELAIQNREKEKRAAELVIASPHLEIKKKIVMTECMLL